MLTFMVVLHVLICMFIIGVVLLQATQQANMGGMFGGGASQTVFGSGTQTALGKATTVSAILFFATCLMISFIVEKERSLIKRSEVILQEKIQGQSAPKEEEAPAGGVSIPATPQQQQQQTPPSQDAPPQE